MKHSKCICVCLCSKFARKKKKRHSHRILLWGRQFANITYQIKAFYQLDQALVLIFVHSASFNSIAGTRTTATTINIDDAVHDATVAVTDKPIVVFSLSLSLILSLLHIWVDSLNSIAIQLEILLNFCRWTGCWACLLCNFDFVCASSKFHSFYSSRFFVVHFGSITF